ncbi:hypothetical protein [uncultured Sphingomonas sp.]|uniref:hypothetical protein n=1 Tax=uncultured Sphingomonas sp. TaxID=158754 RepID=UPI0035C9AFAB
MSAAFPTTALAVVASLIATPALSAPRKDKPVIVPARAIKDATSRICMPRTMSKTVSKDVSQPATLCNTVEEWAVHGVTIVTK